MWYTIVVRKRGIMRTIYNYAFRTVCVYVVILMLFALTSISVDKKNFTGSVVNANGSKTLESKLITKEETTNEALRNEKEKKDSTYSYVPIIDTTAFPVLKTRIGNLSHYGPDCDGCIYGKTASGHPYTDGRIYYYDKTFGKVRIVAAGPEYQFGTILRLSEGMGKTVVAIVLDRGSAIGADKAFALDLLTESQAVAYQLGIRNSVKIEMLRSGY